jgi:hypothetical protein
MQLRDSRMSYGFFPIGEKFSQVCDSRSLRTRLKAALATEVGEHENLFACDTHGNMQLRHGVGSSEQGP